MKRILYILILFSAALSYTACSSHILPEDEPVVETPQADGFTIYAADYVADWTVGSRSLIPLPDELQKQIHNLYYFFYDKEGYIERIYYQNLNPTMRVNVKFTDFFGGGRQTAFAKRCGICDCQLTKNGCFNRRKTCFGINQRRFSW